MVSRTAAERKASERARKRESGLQKVELWLTTKEKRALLKKLKELRASHNQLPEHRK